MRAFVFFSGANGIPFAPTAYPSDEHDSSDLKGLALLKKMNVRMSYMRVINLNHTIIEIQCKKEQING